MISISNIIRRYNPYDGYYYTNSCIVNKTLGNNIFRITYSKMTFAAVMLHSIQYNMLHMSGKLEIF
jgi:hypothetical protein